jgi:hypothetical protein
MDHPSSIFKFNVPFIERAQIHKFVMSVGWFDSDLRGGE